MHGETHENCSLSTHLQQPPPHGCSDPPTAVPLDVGHPSPRGRHHEVVVDPRDEEQEVVVE